MRANRKLAETCSWTRATITFTIALLFAAGITVTLRAAEPEGAKAAEAAEAAPEEARPAGDEATSVDDVDDADDAEKTGEAKEPVATDSDDAAPKRSREEIAQDIQEVGQGLAPLMSSPRDFFDKEKREAMAPKAIPILKRLHSLMEEMTVAQGAGVEPGPRVSGAGTELLSLLVALGDEESLARLKTMSESEKASEAASGKSAQLMARWFRTNAEAEAQGKVLDELAALAKEYPAEDSLTNVAAMMVSTTDAGDKATRDRIKKIVSEDLTGPGAKMMAQRFEEMEEQMAAAERLKQMEGKPLTIEGVLLDGKKFSTADWKGKVILVDFWATWCGPCIGELPRVKETYAKHHEEGLELLGVSCDNSAEDLQTFLEKNKDMPWPQLFDKDKPGWHPLATSYGINGIPTMFLIDRKGVLRSVDARSNFEELIPELLKEKGEKSE